MILAMSPAASWAVMIMVMAAPITGALLAWRRDQRRQRQLDQRIEQRYRQP